MRTEDDEQGCGWESTVVLLGKNESQGTSLGGWPFMSVEHRNACGFVLCHGEIARNPFVC